MMVRSQIWLLAAFMVVLASSYRPAMGQDLLEERGERPVRCVVTVDPQTNAVTAPCPQLGPPALVVQMEGSLTRQLAERTARIAEKRNGTPTEEDRQKLLRGIQSSADKWIWNYTQLLSALSSLQGSDSAEPREAIKAGDFVRAASLLTVMGARADAELSWLAQTNYVLGTLELLRNGPEAALPHFQQSARLAPDQADYRQAIAQMAIWLNRNDMAESTWKDFLALGQQKIDANQIGARAMVGRGLKGLGDFFYQTLRRPEAMKSYEEALSMYRQADGAYPSANNLEIVELLDTLGRLKAAAGDHGGAQGVNIEAVSLWRTIAAANPSYRGQLADQLKIVGVGYLNGNNYLNAEKFLNESLEVYISLDRGNPGKFLYSINEVKGIIAIIYKNTGRSFEAYDINQEILAYYRRAEEGDPGRYAKEMVATLIRLGEAKYEWNDISGSIKFYEDSLIVSRKVEGDRSEYIPKMAIALTNLGSLYCYKGRGADSKAAFYEAFDLYSQLNQKYQNAFAQPLERLKAEMLKRKTCFP